MLKYIHEGNDGARNDAHRSQIHVEPLEVTDALLSSAVDPRVPAEGDNGGDGDWGSKSRKP